MQKRILDKATINIICDEHKRGLSINELSTKLKITRRIIIRTLKENNITPLTKSQLIINQFPILSDRDALRSLYDDKQMSIDDIASYIGTNAQVVKSAFKRLNISTMSPIDKKRTKLLPKECFNQQYWHTEYTEKQKSIRKIAKQLGVSGSLVEAMLAKYNIPQRTKTQARRQLTQQEQLSAKLARRLRSRLSIATKTKQKTGSAVKDLGCSIDDFRRHLESKFQEGMSWDNYGYNGWHIDHIVPLNAFNLEDPNELKKACHYTNLQPLWAQDNFRKNAKTSKPVIILLCGAAASGKSYIAKQLEGLVEYVSYDNTPKIKHYSALKSKSKTGKYVLYDVFRAPGTFIKNFSDEFNIKVVVIKESKETLESLIRNRGGIPKPENIEKAMKTVERWINSYAIFAGTSQEVLQFLRKQINYDE